MTALSYRAERGRVIRIGVGGLGDEPITDAEAKQTRERMLAYADKCAKRDAMNEAANASAVADELTRALADARLWLAEHPQEEKV